MKLCCAVVFAGLVAAGSAAADPFMPGYYAVINYSGAFPNFRAFTAAFNGISKPSMLDGVEANIGWRFNRFYSIEGSYFYYSGQKNSEGESFTAQLQGGSIDALGYLPIGYSSPWALYGDIGGTWYFTNAHTATVTTGTESKFGARAGGGLQYMVDEDLGIRIGGRYDWADLTHLRSAEVFTIGLVWQR